MLAYPHYPKIHGIQNHDIREKLGNHGTKANELDWLANTINFETKWYSLLVQQRLFVSRCD